MEHENEHLQKCKNKTDEVLKMMGQRLGILSIHLPPPSLGPKIAAEMQELSALKTTLYEIFISTIWNSILFCVLSPINFICSYNMGYFYVLPYFVHNV